MGKNKGTRSVVLQHKHVLVYIYQQLGYPASHCMHTAPQEVVKENHHETRAPRGP